MPRTKAWTNRLGRLVEARDRSVDNKIAPERERLLTPAEPLMIDRYGRDYCAFRELRRTKAALYRGDL